VRLHRAALLDALDLVGELAVLHRVTKPSRVIASAQVTEPRLFVDALGDLRKDREVLRLEVVAVRRPAKVEASILRLTG
jgi:hypothetical protein